LEQDFQLANNPGLYSSKVEMVTFDFNFMTKGSTIDNTTSLSMKINSLFDLIPSISRFTGQTFVIKCGNNHIKDPNVIQYIASNIALLNRFGIRVVLVHGGGPQIGEILKKLGGEDSFVDGHRITDVDTFKIVEMVLRGRINADLTSAITENGCSAIGMSGRDGRCIIATKLRRVQRDEGSNIERILDLGMVGEPVSIDIAFFDSILSSGTVPVVIPIGVSETGKAYTINADILAAFIAKKLSANRLILLSDVDGVFDVHDKLITAIPADELESIVNKGVVSVEMMQKAISAIHVVRHGVKSAHIINGCVEHSILVETISDQGIGTMVYASKSRIGAAA